MDSTATGSLWAATAAPAPETAALEGDERADVLVVGAGFTGLSSALHLAERGIEVALLEAEHIGHGGSGRNMGQVNAGFLVLPRDVIRALGPALGERMNAAFTGSADLVFDLIERHAIECDAVRVGNLFLAHDARSLRLIEAFCDQHAALGAPVDWVDRDELQSLLGSPRYIAAVRDARSGNIQPLSYARGLARAAMSSGAAVHTASRVAALTREAGCWRARTAHGPSVTAERVILATDSYSDALWPKLARTLVPITVQQVATRPLGENVGRTLLERGHAASDRMHFTHYFRKDRDGRLLMITGGRSPPPPELLEQFFPQLGRVELEFRWTGVVGMSADHLPRVYRPAPGVLAVVGYSGRGLSAGTLVGRALADHLTQDAPLPIPSPALTPRPFPGLQAEVMNLGLRALGAFDRWSRR